MLYVSVNSVELTNPSSRESEAERRGEELIPDESFESQRTNPLYALFILPVVMIGVGICLGYIRKCLFIRVRNLMNMVDNYMVSAEAGDLDETPVKVLERLHNLSTFDEDSEPELLWDDIIAHNAQDIAEEICQNMTSSKSERRESNSQSNQSTVSSIINVNLDDYFRAINHPTFDIESKENSVQSQIRSSTPIRRNDNVQIHSTATDHNVLIQIQDRSSTATVHIQNQDNSSESKDDNDQIQNQNTSTTAKDHNVENQNQDTGSKTSGKDDNVMDKYSATVHDYPSFNISLSDSSEDVSEDDLVIIIKDQGSTTRSGKRYK